MARLPSAPAVPPRRPSLWLGCGALVGVVALFALAVGSCITFLDSGANTGEVVLLPADSYDDGHIEFIGDHNFFLVRLDDQFYALRDLDSANAANPDRQCRVRLADSEDPTIVDRWELLRARQSPEAAGTLVVLTEDCNGAVYDVTGVRLDADGPNLDRYETSVRDDGRLVVDKSERSCSIREPDDLRAPVNCP